MFLKNDIQQFYTQALEFKLSRQSTSKASPKKSTKLLFCCIETNLHILEDNNKCTTKG